MSINNKKLIKELLTGKLSQEKRLEISDLESVQTELSNQWKQADKKMVNSKVKENIWKGINQKREGKKQNLVHIGLWQLCAACAATVLIMGGIWYTSDTGRKSKEQFIEIAATQNLMYTLPDSSKVWMQRGSKLKFPRAFNEDRSVWLTGNSLFDVRKHQGSTFKVYINKAYIEVKGTSFRIDQTNPNRNNIILFNGKIEFNIESTGQKTMMKPLEKITYNPNNGQTELKKITNLNWENGKYHFTDIPLHRLIAVINSMYESKIILSKGLKHESAFTGSIRSDEPLEDVINKICFTLNLKHEQYEGNIVIKD